MDPMTNTPPKIVMRRGAILVVILTWCSILSLHTLACNTRLALVPWKLGLIPLVMYVSIVSLVVYWSRGRLLFLLASVVVSPFSQSGVQTIHGYVGDVLTSLVKPIHEVAYGGCFFITGEFMLPLGHQGSCYQYWYAKKRHWPSIALLLFPNVL